MLLQDGGTVQSSHRAAPAGCPGPRLMIVNLWRYRLFIVKNALSDVRSQYAGSAAGVAWHVFNPLAQIAIYTVVFSQIMPVRLGAMGANDSFALYLCAGLLPWSAFADCVTRGASAFIENATYLKKLPIPEQVFVAKNAVAATAFLGVSMALLGLVTLITGGRLTLAWLGVPAVLLLFQGFGFGLGLMFSTLNVLFRDIGHALTIGLQLWMWATPVVWVESVLPLRFQPLLLWNPAYPFIDALHRMIIAGTWPPLGQWPVMAAWAAGASLAGYLLLRRLRPEIRDAL
jgi:homopolymeric O-antigen transport system permease protein